MPSTAPRLPRRPDSGAVLITVLLVMIALLGMGVTALWLTTGTMQIGANANMRAQALNVAEIAIERVRQDMNTRPWDDTVKTQLLTGYGHALDQRPSATTPNGIGVIYREVSGKDLANVEFPDATHDTALAGSGIDRSGTLAKMGRYTVWLRNDGAELRRSMYTSDGDNVLVVRAMGVAPDGKTTVVLEVTMGPGSIPSGAPPPLNPSAPMLCNSGKNACDDNSSVQAGVVVQ